MPCAPICATLPPPRAPADRTIPVLHGSAAGVERTAVDGAGLALPPLRSSMFSLANSRDVAHQLSAGIQNGLYCDWDTRPWSGEIAPKVTVNRVD